MSFYVLDNGSFDLCHGSIDTEITLSKQIFHAINIIDMAVQRHVVWWILESRFDRLKQIGFS